MSSWKLTKKLKETSFLRGNSSRRQSNASSAEEPSTPSSSISAEQDSAKGIRGVSSRDTLIESVGNLSVNTNVSTSPEGSSSSLTSPTSRTNTLTEKNQRGTVTSASAAAAASAAAHHPHTSSHHHSAHTSAHAQAPSKSSSANPKLLRVTIYELRNLVVDQFRNNIPSWAFDRSSTKPPPVYLVLDYDKTQILLYAIGGTVEEPVWDKTTSFDLATNAHSEPLSISLYLRTREVVAKTTTQSTSSNNETGSAAGSIGSGREPNGSAAAAAAAAASSSTTSPPGTGSGPSGPSYTSSSEQREEIKLKDILLGSVYVSPNSFNKKDYQPLARGALAMKCEIHNTKNQPLSIEDFTLLKVVGKGSFGKVMQVRKNDTRQIYALKTIRKAHIVSKSEVGHTLAERTVLAKINNPFIVPLKFSFQSPEKLYFVLAFVNGGELFHHLQREGRFDLNRARFYTAELLCALECLHEYNVIYRDLKPENILLDYTGHIALCDFGLCKLNMGTKDSTSTFCGTPEYLAPELLLGQGYTKSVDWWTLGVLFYEMLTGLPPFYDQNINTMYHKIVKDPLTFPPDMDREAKSLITGLLQRDPARRLGTNGASEIKAHPFFHQIDWKFLLNKKYAAPFLPSVASAVDTSNFDSEFTSEVPMDSVVDKEFLLSESVQQQFGGWSYSNESKLATSGKW